MKSFEIQREHGFKWNLIQNCEFEGKFSMPKLKPVSNLEPKSLTAFNNTKSCKNPSEHWFHFFIHDIHFERLWNNPAQYLSVLKRFTGGISPDFSMYMDMPKAQQIWNCWRNRVLAFWLQENMENIIPNACWGDEESLDWAFDGLPENSVLALTTQGCMRKPDECMRILVNGLHELVRRKHPTKLVIYGRFPEVWKERFSIPITVCKSFAEEKWGGK